jgi:hypothetical protein
VASLGASIGCSETKVTILTTLGATVNAKHPLIRKNPDGTCIGWVSTNRDHWDCKAVSGGTDHRVCFCGEASASGRPPTPEPTEEETKDDL